MADEQHPPSVQRTAAPAGVNHHPQPGWTNQNETQPISVPPPPPEGATQEQPVHAHGTAKGSGTSASSVRTLLHVLAAVLVVVGISLPVDGSGVLWTSSATWAAFATAAAAAQLAALGGRTTLNGNAWWIGAAGTAALVLFWTLLMLPVISTNMAFLVTLGTAAAVTAVAKSPDRRL